MTKISYYYYSAASEKTGQLSANKNMATTAAVLITRQSGEKEVVFFTAMSLRQDYKDGNADLVLVGTCDSSNGESATLLRGRDGKLTPAGTKFGAERINAAETAFQTKHGGPSAAETDAARKRAAMALARAIRAHTGNQNS